MYDVARRIDYGRHSGETDDYDEDDDASYPGSYGYGTGSYTYNEEDEESEDDKVESDEGKQESDVEGELESFSDNLGENCLSEFLGKTKI